jgi:hypothetical protein
MSNGIQHAWRGIDRWLVDDYRITENTKTVKPLKVVTFSDFIIFTGSVIQFPLIRPLPTSSERLPGRLAALHQANLSLRID